MNTNTDFLLNEDIRQEISFFCNEFPLVEVGGVILNKCGDFSAIKCQNVSESPENSFFINRQEWLDLEKEGKISAVFHSHREEPTSFSEADIYMSEKMKIISILFNTLNQEFLVYAPKGIKINLIGRPYYPGILDCISLVVDYYKQKLNINISDLSHAFRFFPDILKKTQLIKKINKEDSGKLEEYYKSNGFIEIGKSKKIKKGDLILSRSAEYIQPSSHVAIYIGDGKILHHPDTGSEYDYFKSEFPNPSLVNSIMRHKEML